MLSLYEKFLKNHRKIIIIFGVLSTLKLFFIFGGLLYLSLLSYETADIPNDMFWFRTFLAFGFFFTMVFAEIAFFGILWSMYKRDQIAQHLLIHKTLDGLDLTPTTRLI